MDGGTGRQTENSIIQILSLFFTTDMASSYENKTIEVIMEKDIRKIASGKVLF